MDLSGHDVYLNVAGGMRVKEPAADLAVILALASSFREAALPGAMAAWGEVGLAGELRPVTAGDRRVSEAAALGIKGVIVPLSKNAPASAKKPAALRMKEASTVREALAAAFAGAPPKATVPVRTVRVAQGA
jgi:DNA repair protein RadA/Sms